MLIQRSQIVAEIEAVEGAKETLVAADVFLGFKPGIDHMIEAHERDPVRSSLSPHGSVFGGRSARFRFDVELVGTSAGAGNAIHFSDALQACGVGETLVGSTSATYKPVSSSVPSVTLGWYHDGKAFKIWGTRGNAVLNLEAGKPGIISMEFLGADWEEVDEALLSSITYEAAKPPTFQGASLSIDSYSAIVSKLSLDLGNVLALRPDANASSGNKSCIITNRKPIISFDPEDVLVATEAFVTNWKNGSEMAFTATLGSVAGNTIAITAPKVQYQSIAQGERDGVMTKEISGLCCLNTGDDEWQIQIT